MKIKLVALGIIGLSWLAFFLYKRNKDSKQLLPQSKENERRHLTNVFSTAKNLAVGNHPG